MIVNNTQANVFKVNGGLADNFANRPAANSSFFIFYSIDTQQIFYDNGAWVLIGSGAPSVNIYNSNGTLTGNRALNGGGFDLFFSNLDDIHFNSQSISLRILNSNDSIITQKSGYQVGLKLDYLNGVYALGDFQSIFGSTFFVIDDAANKLTTGNNIGAAGFDFDILNNIYKYGDLSQSNQSKITIDSANDRIYTSGTTNQVSGIDIYPNLQQFYFGVNSTNNLTHLFINDVSQTAYFSNQGTPKGLQLDFANNLYQIGDNINNNQLNFVVNNGISSTTQFIATQEYLTNTGLFIDYFYRIHCLGFADGGDFFNTITGYKLDQTANNIILGDTWANQPTYILIDYSNNQLIKTVNQGNDIGLKLDFANNVYEFGQMTGGNTTFLTIDDAAAYPLQFDGNNIVAGSSGSSSGQHLKVKVNGTDYVIELKNP